MAESLFASLLHTLDKGSISQIAATLGESEHNVARGMEASIASVLGSLVSKAEDPGGLRRMLDLVPASLGDLSWSKLATGFTTSGSSWMQTGKQLLGGVFRSDDNTVANAVAKDSGVSSATAMSLLAMAAPMVLSSLNRLMREQGWTIRGLGTALEREAATIRSALPTGVAELLWPRALAATAESPGLAHTVQQEKASTAWVGVLALSLAALGCFWLWAHGRRPAERAATVATGEANRMIDDTPRLGDFVRRRLPNGVELNVPADGIESRLIVIINGALPQSSRVDFDRLQFDSGSARLRPASAEQVENIAAILKAYPNVHLKLSGYTDNAGNAGQNLDLSRARADSVKSELTARGISPDRITTEGFGEAATADNSTAAGRARNRRVSVQVTQR